MDDRTEGIILGLVAASGLAALGYALYLVSSNRTAPADSKASAAAEETSGDESSTSDDEGSSEDVPKKLEKNPGPPLGPDKGKPTTERQLPRPSIDRSLPAPSPSGPRYPGPCRVELGSGGRKGTDAFSEYTYEDGRLVRAKHTVEFTGKLPRGAKTKGVSKKKKMPDERTRCLDYAYDGGDRPARATIDDRCDGSKDGSYDFRYPKQQRSFVLIAKTTPDSKKGPKKKGPEKTSGDEAGTAEKTKKAGAKKKGPGGENSNEPFEIAFVAPGPFAVAHVPKGVGSPVAPAPEAEFTWKNSRLVQAVRKPGEESDESGARADALRFGYNDAGQLTEVRMDRGNNGSVERTVQYEYDEHGNLTESSIERRGKDRPGGSATASYGCW